VVKRGNGLGSGGVLLLGSIEVGLEIAEVVLADAEVKNLVDHRKQVMQRPNGLERNGIRGAEDTTRGGQDQRVFDDGDRHATIIKNRGEETIIATDSASGSRRSAIGIENFADVILFGDLHDFISGVSSLGIAQ
jgi:hypothetical protein